MSVMSIQQFTQYIYANREDRSQTFDDALFEYLQSNAGANVISIDFGSQTQYLTSRAGVYAATGPNKDNLLSTFNEIGKRHEGFYAREFVSGDGKVKISTESRSKDMVSADTLFEVNLEFDERTQTLRAHKVYAGGREEWVDVTQIASEIENIAIPPVQPTQVNIISIEQFTQDIYANRKDRSQTFDAALTEYLLNNEEGIRSVSINLTEFGNEYKQYLFAHKNPNNSGQNGITTLDHFAQNRDIRATYDADKSDGKTNLILSPISPGVYYRNGEVMNVSLEFNEATQTLSGRKIHYDGSQKLVEITQIKKEVKPIQPTQPTQPTQPGNHTVSQKTLDLLKQYGVDLSNPNWMDDITGRP